MPFELEVAVGPQFGGTALGVELPVKEDQMVGLGTTSVAGLGEGALILLVEADVEDPA
jgi:hypothetical protein